MDIADFMKLLDGSDQLKADSNDLLIGHGPTPLDEYLSQVLAQHLHGDVWMAHFGFSVRHELRQLVNRGR